MGRGRDKDAVDVVHKVAAYNGKESKLTLEHLTSIGQWGPVHSDAKLDTSARAAVRRQVAKFDTQHVKALFATRQLA
jgi:hypothetical protein